MKPLILITFLLVACGPFEYETRHGIKVWGSVDKAELEEATDVWLLHCDMDPRLLCFVRLQWRNNAWPCGRHECAGMHFWGGDPTKANIVATGFFYYHELVHFWAFMEYGEHGHNERFEKLNAASLVAWEELEWRKELKQ